MNSVHRYVGCLAAVLVSPDNNLRRVRICGGRDSDLQVFRGYGFPREEASNASVAWFLVETVSGREGTYVKRVGLELRRLGARTNWSLKHVMKSSWHVAVWIDYYYCEF